MATHVHSVLGEMHQFSTGFCFLRVPLKAASKSAPPAVAFASCCSATMSLFWTSFFVNDSATGWIDTQQ